MNLYKIPILLLVFFTTSISVISQKNDLSIFQNLTDKKWKVEGTIIMEGKNIAYQYQYQYGASKITDMWYYRDDDTYTFNVGDYQNGVWKQVYLET